MVKFSLYPKGATGYFKPLLSDTENGLIIPFKDLRVKQSGRKEACEQRQTELVENLWIISEQYVGISLFHYSAVVYGELPKRPRLRYFR